MLGIDDSDIASRKRSWIQKRTCEIYGVRINHNYTGTLNQDVWHSAYKQACSDFEALQEMGALR